MKLLILFSLIYTVKSQISRLKQVHVLMMPGSHSPLHKFPWYKEDVWSDGPAQLTLRGKEESFEVGKWLRWRYGNFVDAKYRDSQVAVRSVDESRALLTATLAMAGLYPATPGAAKEPVSWQVVPVHTTPPEVDSLLNPVACEEWTAACQQYALSASATRWWSSVKDFATRVGNLSGVTDEMSADKLMEIHCSLDAERQAGHKWPAWMNESTFLDLEDRVLPQHMAHKFATDLQKRLALGVFLQKLVKDLRRAAVPENKVKKMFIYVASEEVLVGMMEVLEAYNLKMLRPASVFVIELFADEGKGEALRFLLRTDQKSQAPNLLPIYDGITSKVSLTKFTRKVEHLLLDPRAWRLKCQPDLDIAGVSVYRALLSGSCLLLVLLSLVFVLGCYRARLPSTEHQPIEQESQRLL